MVLLLDRIDRILQDILFFIFITFLLPAMLRNARRTGMKVMKNNPPIGGKNC